MSQRRTRRSTQAHTSVEDDTRDDSRASQRRTIRSTQPNSAVEDDSTASQRRTIRSTRPNTSVEDDDLNLDDAVKECARYILCREGSKIPIKRADIAKHLNTACDTPSHHVSKVLTAAERLLRKVYGYKLVQVGLKGTTQYIIVLAEECESLPPTSTDPQQRLMLMATLTHIFMSGGNVKEDDMWKFLSECGLLDENDFVGKKSFITTFTRQSYLTFTKVGDGDMARNVFEWGKRATEEVPKMFILNKMAEAFEKTPDHWCEQHTRALEDKKQRS